MASFRAAVGLQLYVYPGEPPLAVGLPPMVVELPVQMLLLPPLLAAAAGFTVAVVVPAVEGQPPTVAVTL